MGTEQHRSVRAVAALVVAVGLLAAAVGCTSDDDAGSDGERSGATSTTAPRPTAPEEVELTGSIDVEVEDAERCDPIAEGCLLPFPNDHFTEADDATPTGRRVALDEASMPVNEQGVSVDPTHWNDLDGFSPAAAALVQIPDVDLETSGAASLVDPSTSLADGSAVVLLDATTGERLPHWTELDEDAESGSVPTMFVRPAVFLPEGHRIVVAMRGLVDTSGDPIEPTEAFRAYRDRLDTGDPVLEERRPAMEQVFADLDAADVAREELVLAWDFTVASAEALSARMLHLRDDAFERLADDAPAFTVTTDEPSDREGIAREVSGTYEIPLYLSGAGEAGSSFELGDDGLPTHTGTYTAPFHCIVPESATADQPSSTGIYGHGLLGTGEQVGAATEVAAEGNRTFCATDLIGMSESDFGNAATIVSELSTFNTLADRLQQGHLNTLVLGRLMIHPDGLGTHEAFRDGDTSVLTDDLAYYGISQGGIMGAATTAIAQDWTNAALGVPGANYGLLLDRSVDFDDFRLVYEPSYPAAADRALGLQLIQMLWDRGEASGYLQHLTAEPYADTPEHRVLLHAAFGDHQVANVSTAVEARSIGAAAVRPVLADGRSPEDDPFWDIPEIESYPHEGSAVVMWDSGAAPPPLENVPPRTGEDPHGDPRGAPAAIEQIVEFLESGTVIDACGGEPCTAEPRD
ncbi:MAG TPA: hypothetical protein VHK88_06710 [Aquihabitans sp.]|jgi:hypothetical protein|nr:hypothetical protein [Aquihabitans sp.]